MNMTIRRLLPMLLLSTLFSCRCGDRTPVGENLTLLLTHDLAGAIAAPVCERCEAGGLARRLTALHAARSEVIEPCLLVEGGDFLTADDPRDLRDPARRLARAQLIADAYGEARYDVVLFGHRDYALGLPALRDLAARMNVAVLGANVRDARTGESAWPADVVLQAGKLTVGLFGLTDRLPADGEARLDDPVETARRVAADLRSRVDLVILVANLEQRTLLDVLAQTEGIDLTLRSGAGRRLHKPGADISGTPVVSLRYGERQIGRLAVTLAEPGAPLVDHTESLALERKIELYRTWMAEQEKLAGGKKQVEAYLVNEPKTLQRYRRYRETEAEWTAALARMRGTGNFFAFRTVRPDDNLVPDGATAGRVAGFFAQYGPDAAAPPEPLP